MPVETRTCYSLNDEEYNHSCLTDLMSELEDQGGLAVGAEYWEADTRPLGSADAFRIEHLLEDADELIFEEVGEIYDNDLSSVTPEAKIELRDLLLAWCDKHVNLAQYDVIEGRSRKKTITAADIEDFHAPAGINSEGGSHD